MANKITKKVNGVEYTFQNVSGEWYLNLIDEVKDDSGHVKTGEYMNRLLGAMLVKPKFKKSDYDGKIRLMRTLNKIAEEFVMGEEPTIEDVEEKNDEQPEENDLSEE